MKLNLRVYGNLKQIVGNRDTVIDVPELTTLNDLPEVLKPIFGEEFYQLIKGDTAFMGMRVLVDGRDLLTLDGLKTVLFEGNTVTILPPIVGGALG